ncbi:MAG: phosphatase PAP2 family protein [Fidelibacterota bacterium]|nr:MAG: phosphatase PAP2 family protein [Candidatus Neomarinimicrobiota bacterium]
MNYHQRLRIRYPGTAAFFLILALHNLAQGGILRTDSLLTATLQGSNDHPVWNLTMESISLLTPVVEVGWTLRQGYLGCAGSDPRAAETFRLAAGSLLITQAAVTALKYALKRERPARDYQPRLWNTRITPSFPSGHTASSAAWAAIAAGRYPRSAPIAAAYALVSAWSQVYVGNHYVGDVLAGAVTGMVIGKWILSRTGGSSGADQDGHPLILPPITLGLRLELR